ncbi:hypothetical protein FRB98_006936, partial [Tulasnella sp. 332]
MSQPSDASPSSVPSSNTDAMPFSAQQLQQIIAALAPVFQQAAAGAASSPAPFVGPPSMNPAI